MKLKPRSRQEAQPASPPRNILAAIEHNFGPIEYWSLDRLRRSDRNPRLHPERQMTALVANVQNYGIVMPILVTETGEIIAGEARFEAARRINLTAVPVLVARCWSEAQIRSYRLADNRLAELAKWSDQKLALEIAEIIDLKDISIEAIGWSTGEIDKLLDLSVKVEPENLDEVPELPAKPVSQLGDLWCLGAHRLYNGSSLEAASWSLLMNGRVADLCLSDGPYNVRVNGHVSSTGRFKEFAFGSGEMSEAEFIAFNTTWLSAASKHLRDGALVMAFMDHAHLFELMTAAREAGLKHLNLCVWAKTNAGMGSLWRSQYELVLVLKHGSAAHTNCVELGRHGRYRSNLWTVAGTNAFGRTRDADLAAHPTVKPQELLTEAIRDVTRQGELVVDAFSGSGSTILACERTKRVGYAIELEPGYIDVAVRRWEQLTGRTATLEATGQSFAEVMTERLSA